MQKKRLVASGLLLCLLLTGCKAEIKPDSAKDGTYATQNPLTALEYGIYMNKQITVFINQLVTRMGMIHNSQDSSYENEAQMAEESAKIMEDILEEVTVTYPSKTAEDDREAVILAMETAIEHMEDYVKDADNEKDTKIYAEVFQNDINILTGFANVYYQ